MIEFDDIAMIDSRQCFMIDESIEEKVISLSKYEIVNKRVP
jgi:hypothetical protein